MNENALTRRLILDTLARADASVTQRFCRRVAGIDVQERSGGGYAFADQATLEDFGHTQALVLGVAPRPGLASRDRRTAPGSIVDAVIAGDVALLIEFKITGQCERAQLVRHAQHWAMQIQCPYAAWNGEPRDGFALRTWSDIGDWLTGELAGGDLSVRDRTLLERMSTTLRAAGLGTDPSLRTTQRSSCAPVGVERPPVARRAEMTTGADLPAIYQACQRLYGKAGTHQVSATGCVDDVAQTRARFIAADVPIPPGLVGDAMTNRRVLTVLYAGSKKTDATPAAWTDLRTRVLERGGDRLMLLALLAWADQHGATEAGRRIERTVARVWSQTPAVLPALPELHHAVGR